MEEIGGWGKKRQEREEGSNEKKGEGRGSNGKGIGRTEKSEISRIGRGGKVGKEKGVQQ